MTLVWPLGCLISPLGLRGLREANGQTIFRLLYLYIQSNAPTEQEKELTPSVWLYLQKRRLYKRSKKYPDIHRQGLQSWHSSSGEKSMRLEHISFFEIKFINELSIY